MLNFLESLSFTESSGRVAGSLSGWWERPCHTDAHSSACSLRGAKQFAVLHMSLPLADFIVVLVPRPVGTGVYSQFSLLWQL